MSGGMDQGRPPGAMGQPKTGRGQRASWSAAAAGPAEGEVDHGRTQNMAIDLLLDAYNRTLTTVS